MNTRAVIEKYISELMVEEGVEEIPELNDQLVLLDAGLDSLGFAVLVTRLEDALGYDPFSLMSEAFYPVTLGDFVRVYEQYAPAK